jgi:hypothetical protein
MTSAQRWEPESEAEVLAAIADGSLAESHYFDVKREVGSSSGERADLARHLASFAIDGGSLLIGVEEDKANRTWVATPQPLGGLPERLEQIATQLIDPPLYTVARELPAKAGGGLGYLLVHVPPSAQAPHMVGGIYYGRGDRTRTRLSDAEVLRHHARREAVEELAERLLDEEIARDPESRQDLRVSGRLYAGAQPLVAPRHVGRAFVAASQQELWTKVLSVEAAIPQLVREASPTPRMLSSHSRRSHGVALSDYSVTGPGRTLRARSEGTQPNDEDMLDLEFREDGGIRLLVGRLTALRGGRSPGEAPYRLVLDALGLAYTLRLVRWAAVVAGSTGYRGGWVFGVHGTGMRGLSSSVHAQDWTQSGDPFDADLYRETTTATYEEISSRPEAVAHRLIGRLLRALSTEAHWSPVLEPDGR